MRHTTATVLLEVGVHPKVVQDLLGHSTIAVTLDTSSHVAPALHSQAIGALERQLMARSQPRSSDAEAGTCGVNQAAPTRSGSPDVLAEHPAEPINTLDRTGRRCGWQGRGRLQRQAPVRASVVVMIDELAQNLIEVPLAEDKNVVKALTAGCSDPALRDGIHSRASVGGLEHLHGLGPEYLIKAAAELGVAISDQEPCSDIAILQRPSQVPSLLEHPFLGRVISTASKMDPAGAEFDEEECVEAAEEDGIHREEVDRQNRVGIGRARSPAKCVDCASGPARSDVARAPSGRWCASSGDPT
jgi:hypothetical protein